MKKFLLISLLLILLLHSPVFAVQKTTKAISTSVHTNQKGSLKIKAGIVLKSGDVKFIAKRQFYLTTKSFMEIFLKKLDEKPTMQEWLALNGASKELIEASLSYSELQDRYLFFGLHYFKCYSFEQDNNKLFYQLLSIPELRNYCQDCINLKQRAQRDFRYRGQHIDAQKYIPEWLYLGFYPVKIKNTKLSLLEAKEEVRNYIVNSCQTDFDGKCTINNIKPGKYYLTSANVIEITTNKLIWDIPATIKTGVNKLEPSNENLEEIDKNIMEKL